MHLLGSLHEYSKTRYFQFPTLVADLSIFGPLYYVKTGALSRASDTIKLYHEYANITTNAAS